MNYRFHPEAAREHEEQAAYYEAQAAGLGARYNAAFRSAVLRVNPPYRAEAPGSATYLPSRGPTK